MGMTIDELNEKSKSNTAPTENREDVIIGNKYEDDSLGFASLSNKEKIKYRLKQYKDRSEGMPPLKKLAYTITFFKYPFLAVFIASFIIVISSNVIYTATLPTLVKVAIINEQFKDDSIDEYINRRMRDYLGVNNRNVSNIYKNKYVAADENPEMIGVNMTDYQNLGHYVLNDNLDIYIVDSAALKTYTWSEDTTAIDLAVDEKLYEIIKDDVVYLTDKSEHKKNDGKPYAGALDITDTDFVKYSGITYSPVYLLVPSTKFLGNNNERTINFIKMVYEVYD